MTKVTYDDFVDLMNAEFNSFPDGSLCYAEKHQMEAVAWFVKHGLKF